MDDLNQYTPLIMKILVAAVTGLIPSFGWLAKALWSIHSRLDKMDSRLDNVKSSQEAQFPNIEKLRAEQGEDRNRIVIVEQAVLRLTDMQQRADGHYADLSNRLEILPRIDESLKYLARVCSTIVPREEWELNNKLYDERLKRTEKQ